MARTFFRGVEEAFRKARQRVEQLQRDAKRELVRGCEGIMTRSKREFVPVDLGALKNSGVVIPDSDPKRIACVLAYGGPAAPYAIIQHEKVFNHKIGEDHYLSKPVFEDAPKVMEKVAGVIKF